MRRVATTVATGSRRQLQQLFVQSGPGGRRVRAVTVATTNRRAQRRLVVTAVVLTAVFGLIVAKLVDLQVLNPQAYAAYAASQRERIETLAAERGAIVDRNGAVLALSVSSGSVYVDPSALAAAKGDAPAVAAKLADAMAGVPGVDARTIQAKLEGAGQFAYIARHVDDAVTQKVKDLIATEDPVTGTTVVPGVAVLDEPKRTTTSAGLARSLIGLADADGRGIAGIEQMYDEQLTGTPGKLVIERDPDGRTIASAEPEVVPAVKGDDIELTIDRSMQYETEQILAEQVRDAGAKGGVAIVMKPDTGEVLAMANVVTDPETGEVRTDSNNAALTTVFEPGSVMKVVAASAALERGLVTPKTEFTLPPKMQICDQTFGEAEDERGTVTWPVSEILSQSSNIGTIQLADRVGRQGVYDTMRAFGIGEKTAIGFPNEPSGSLSEPKDWSCSDRGSIPIGQGVSVTPLQMLATYNVIANRGVYAAPKLVGATIDGEGTRTELTDDAGHRVVSEQTADQINVMLRGVVEEGTGTAAAIKGYAPAGKTGTARIPSPDGGGYRWKDGNYHYDSSFVGFVPAEAPALSVFVKITDPSKQGIFGGVVAAPAFSKIGSAALRRFQVAPPGADIARGGIPTTPAGTPFARQRAQATSVTTTTVAPPVVATVPPATATPSTTVTTTKKSSTPAAGAPPSSSPTTAVTKRTTSTTIAKR